MIETLLFYCLAWHLILSPEEPPRERIPDSWVFTQHLKEVGVGLEIYEQNSWIHPESRVALDTLRARWKDIQGKPSLGDIQRFPPTDTLADIHKFQLRLLEHLKTQKLLFPGFSGELDFLIDDLCIRLKIIGLMNDVQIYQNYDRYAARMALGELRDLLGTWRYSNCIWPDPFPEGVFKSID